MKSLNRTHTFVRNLRDAIGLNKNYNPALYFRDHEYLVSKWSCAIKKSERDELEAEINELNKAHLKYISRKQGDV